MVSAQQSQYWLQGIAAAANWAAFQNSSHKDYPHYSRNGLAPVVTAAIFAPARFILPSISCSSLHRSSRNTAEYCSW